MTFHRCLYKGILCILAMTLKGYSATFLPLVLQHFSTSFICSSCCCRFLFTLHKKWQCCCCAHSWLCNYTLWNELYPGQLWHKAGVCSKWDARPLLNICIIRSGRLRGTRRLTFMSLDCGRKLQYPQDTCVIQITYNPHLPAKVGFKPYTL